MQPVFHLSLSVTDLDRMRRFYEDVLGARTGRATDRWIDLWLFGAQMTAYQRPAGVVPSPFREAQHFGATLAWDDWLGLSERLEQADAPFRLKPTVDETGERAKMMLTDPDGYLVEIKAYRDPAILHGA